MSRRPRKDIERRSSLLPHRLGGRREGDSAGLRLLRALADNLGNLLRVLLVAGAIHLTMNIDRIMDAFVDARRPPQVVEAPVTEPPVAEPPVAADAAEAAGYRPSEGVKRALRCTYTEYRRDHYDECVPEGESEVWDRQEALEDDGSAIFARPEQLYASVD